MLHNFLWSSSMEATIIYEVTVADSLKKKSHTTKTVGQKQASSICKKNPL